MANTEHLDILNQGIDTWNQWRDANPNIRPDLQQASLKGKHLCKINLSRADLSGANLSGADLKHAHLIGANLNRAFMRWADLSRSTLRGAYLWGTDLSGTTLEQVDLSHAKLRGATLRWADLTCARLTQANLRGATLIGATLCSAILKQADCRWTEMRWADLRGAHLNGVDLRWADLRGGDLRQTSLVGAIALTTDFTGAVFTGACIENWKISMETKLDELDCAYIYLKSAEQERHPQIGDFLAGEFRTLVQRSLTTIDLIFVDGIDWLAFVAAFQSLCTEFSQDYINLQALEKKDGGVFTVRLEVSLEANQERIESQLKQYYSSQLKTVERYYKYQKIKSNEHPPQDRHQHTDIKEIAKLLAIRQAKGKPQTSPLHRSTLKVTS